MCTAAAGASAATWHVRSGAPAGGDGSAGKPFDSLAALEAASGPGDSIVVDPAPNALDGGIALKPGQRLTGGGASAVISNTTDTHIDGDGVRLANDATVTNLVIRNTRRGAIYGLDSVGVKISGNDVSKHNTSCTKGFLVQPFNVPTGVPFVGGGAAGMGTLAPQNGWAGIMVDGDIATGNVEITGNVLHDGDCGDGIDIRAAGSSNLTARVDRNTVTKLKQGDFGAGAIGSVLAIGMQARDSGRLTVTQDGNSQTDIGSDGADCEGQFANTSEAGVIYDTVSHNTFKHAIGGSSCNGFEAIVSNGGGMIDVHLTDSTFEDNVGDMFEEGNLGAGSTMRWEMDHVIARKTSQRSDNSPSSSDPGSNPIPFNLGDCMVLGHNGGGNSTTFIMRNSVLEQCNNGISALSGQEASNGVGPAAALNIDISHSRIADNAKYGIQVANTTPLNIMHVRVADSEVTGSGSYGIAVDQGPSGTTADTRIDLGGGALGSPGANCLYKNAKGDAEASAYSVRARSNWWGHAGAPTADQVVTARGGAIDAAKPLTERPDCAPQPPSEQVVAGVKRSSRTGLTVHITPRRDLRGKRRFTTTGAIRPPAGVSRSAACQGRVAIQVRAGHETISTRQARVSRTCRFRSTVVFSTARRFRGHDTLEFTVRFQGNALLAQRSAGPYPVRVR
ncbi:MAG: hypothetical protein QOJ29_4708 [Thermoleophilaceae bacterium]|nr:hypothetical protein [Thermoleophilaceae bacterium]